MRGIREVARPTIGKAGPEPSGSMDCRRMRVWRGNARQRQRNAKAVNKDVTSQGISKNQQ